MAKSEINNQQSEIDAAKAALSPFARISPKGGRVAVVKKEGDAQEPEFTGSYTISRARRQAVITEADILLAAKCVEDARAPLDQCLKALRPFAKLPVDLRIEDPKAAVYAFPALDSGEVAITNAMIEAAQELVAG